MGILESIGANRSQRTGWTLFFVVLGFFLVSLLVIMEGAEGKTITVDDDGNGDYERIQQAIDNATDGDTIRVWDGTYLENVVVDKALRVSGNGSDVTIIDGGGEGTVVSIIGGNITFSGIRVIGSGAKWGGIGVNSNNNRIENNLCVNHTGFGIALGRCRGLCCN